MELKSTKIRFKNRKKTVNKWFNIGGNISRILKRVTNEANEMAIIKVTERLRDKK